jgi:hypothetical protein
MASYDDKLQGTQLVNRGEQTRNEERAKHLGANKAINTYQALQRSPTVCEHKTVVQ